VKDNGKGFTEHGHQGAGKLGLEIVEALSEQLDGSFHVHQVDGGVLFEVLFRMRHPSPILPDTDREVGHGRVIYRIHSNSTLRSLGSRPELRLSP
jgi:hypothetical protein